jgi:predicted nucleic-acid-binding protein
MVAGSLDTNLLVRLITRDVEQEYELVCELLDQHGVQYIVPDLAIAELVFVLGRHYSIPRDAIRHCLIQIILHPSLKIKSNLILKTLAYFAKHTALSFEDCYYACLAEDTKTTPLITFDKDLVKKFPRQSQLLTQ